MPILICVESICSELRLRAPIVVVPKNLPHNPAQSSSCHPHLLLVGSEQNVSLLALVAGRAVTSLKRYQFAVSTS